ncbi:50S ribosomal protein L4 [Candidatus Falkowbacteria bacterium]|nr:50S ribosomal protein L4 [Candidatus Falkowbacteria bacterium]
MAKVKVYNLDGKEVEQLELDPKIFEIEANPALVHQVIEVQRANSRLKLAHTKTRGEVRGGGKKPWRQKGTGRARHGSIRSPLWIGGGITFGPRNEREYGKKINKKMRKKALFMTLSDKVKEKCFIVVDNLTLPEIKTKKFYAILEKLPMKGISSTLVVLKAKDENINKSARNIKKVKTILADSLNVYDILKYNFLLIDKEGVQKIIDTYKQ